MLFQRVLILLWNLSSVYCAIHSLNNKYSSNQKLRSMKIDHDGLTIAIGDRNDRFKRSNGDRSPTTSSLNVTPSSSSIHDKSGLAIQSDPEVVVESFVLNGSQKSNQAFIHWIGKANSERIIVLTCSQNVSDGSRRVVDSQVWRSNNYGSSFEEKSLGPDAKISYFYTFPQSEKKLLFTDVAAKTVYTTKDELDTWSVSAVPIEPDIVLPHPDDDNKMLIYSMNQRKLYVSTDFAGYWSFLSDNVLPNFYWGVNGFDSNTDVVHMEVDAGIPSQAKYKACIVPDCKDVTFDDIGPFLAESLVVHKEYIFVQKSSLLDTESYLMVSYNRTKFQRAYFPGDLKTDDFMLLNLDDGQVFVAVNHGDHVSLYLSEVTGQYYVLSFPNIYHILRLGYFEIDFFEVQGMNWTFLANRNEPGGVKTFISFDKGGNWAPLTLNRSCLAAEQCALLLEVKSSSLMSSMVSQENAPGIIIAHGIPGPNIRGQESTVFTSSDGGATWLKAVQQDETPLVGRFRFNILDQGGILTAIPDGLLTDHSNTTVYYSCDEGKHWKQQKFSNNDLLVKGVLTEPGSLTMVESVFGHQGLMMPWTVIKLNFSKVLAVKCGEKDFEYWNPRDYNNMKYLNNSCILGHIIKYKRRKPDAKCFFGETVVPRIEHNGTCPCTREDYECDFGYEKGNDDCQKASWFTDAYSPPECNKGDTYFKSQGFRKIPADTCVENTTIHSKFGKTKTTCELVAPSKLAIMLQTRKLPSGKEVVFHLEQAGGSKFDTKYTWTFGDGSKPEEDIGFQNTSVKKHIFRAAGHYTINVTAENSKGKTNASAQIHVQDPLVGVYMVAPVAGKTGVAVTFSVLLTSSNRMVETTSDHVHFAWTFGDEGVGNLPMLTWNNSVSHIFGKAGTYTMSVEAVNSMSSIYKEQSIQIFDDAEILVLTFSRNVEKYAINPFLAELFTLRTKQQLAEDLGLNLARLEAVIASTGPTTAHLYIFSSTVSGEPSVATITESVINQVQKHILGVNLFGKIHEAGEIISITSARKLSNPDHPSGLNMKAMYIAVPVLILVVVVSFMSFLYCRKKLRNLHQYNILHTHDDSDALLDDDEAPLDLNVDFGTRESSRDDAILDAGGSHLVMVTGGGSSDNAENC